MRCATPVEVLKLAKSDFEVGILGDDAPGEGGTASDGGGGAPGGGSGGGGSSSSSGGSSSSSSYSIWSF